MMAARFIGASVPAPASPLPAYFDLNRFPTYRASESGLPAPVVTVPTWADMNDQALYRASEWGTGAAGPSAGVLYHDLMIVK
jgi:hypothetical protein